MRDDSNVTRDIFIGAKCTSTIFMSSIDPRPFACLQKAEMSACV